MKSWKNCVVWITGGGTGIGKALAVQLCRREARVLITGRRREVLEAAASEIGAVPRAQIMAISGDASDPAHIENVLKTLRSRWGEVDVLINNAGANNYHSFDQTTPEEFIASFEGNCVSAIRCAKAVLPVMRQRGFGTIVNVSSILGRWASPDSPSYSVSKYALAGLTDSLRQELIGTGVKVIGVYPGFILTPMTMPFVSAGSRRWRFGRTPEAMATAIVRGIERGRREVLFPGYVPLVLHLHHFFPGLMERLRHVFRR
jgi:short-subunit dehydrogenase